MPPAKGSPTVTVRVKPIRLAALLAEVERLNRNPLGEPWTVSRFIAKAIDEKLALNLRRRSTRRKKPSDDKRV